MFYCLPKRRLLAVVFAAVLIAPKLTLAQSATNDSLYPFDPPDYLDWPKGLFHYSFGVDGPQIGVSFSLFQTPFLPHYTDGITGSLINTRGMRANRSYDIPKPPIAWNYILLNYLEYQVNSNNSAYVWGEAFHDKGARQYLGVKDRLLDFKHNDQVNDADFRAVLDYMRKEMPNSNALPYLEWYNLYKTIGEGIAPDNGLPGVATPPLANLPTSSVNQVQPTTELPGLGAVSMTSELPEFTADASLPVEPTAMAMYETFAAVPEPTTLALTLLGLVAAIRRR